MHARHMEPIHSVPCPPPRSRFLQGAGTDQATVTQIREAVKSGAELTVRILNYTKSGRPFWNMFTLAPMRDADGHARFFVGVQVRSAWLFPWAFGLVLKVNVYVRCTTLG